MLSDYMTLFSFFLLSIVLFIVAKASGIAQELNILGESKVQSTDSYSNLSEKLLLWTRMAALFIVFFLFTRLFTTVSLPLELDGLPSVSAELIHYVLVGIFYLIFWFLFLYLLIIQTKIKIENRATFLQSVFRYLIALTIFDLSITGFLYINGFISLFSGYGPVISEDLPFFSSAGTTPMFFVIVLFIVVSLLFAWFMLRRSLKIARNYWIAVLLLIFSIILFWINDLVKITGWNESAQLQIDLLHWRYGFIGLIFLAMIGCSIFFNLASIILLNIRGQVVAPQHTKKTIINFQKMGYATILFATLLALAPKLLMFIY